MSRKIRHEMSHGQHYAASRVMVIVDITIDVSDRLVSYERRLMITIIMNMAGYASYVMSGEDD